MAVEVSHVETKSLSPNVVEAPDRVFSVCFAVELTVSSANQRVGGGVVPAGKPLTAA